MKFRLVLILPDNNQEYNIAFGLINKIAIPDEMAILFIYLLII